MAHVIINYENIISQNKKAINLKFKTETNKIASSIFKVDNHYETIIDAETFNILSQNLTLKKIINYFRKYKKNIKIKYEKSKLINQYSYEISNHKFSSQAIVLKSNIYSDIKETLNIFRNINNEM